MWRHIDFYFKGEHKDADSFLNPKEQFMFEKCVANIITDCRRSIRRKFYLWEPEPHCFLAIEVSFAVDLNCIRRSLEKHIKNLDFIKSARINPKIMNDEVNGEDFLMILNAFTEAYLFHRKSKMTHIIHCCLEFITQSREKEVTFYKTMLALYGGEEFR